MFFLFGSVEKLKSQNKIHFADITIKAATQRANIENKNIFVDTYAPWCGPCKIMDIHFQDKEVVNYFNRNFINVKIDTDTPYGKKVSAKYQIAFLPTILILTKDGQTRFKVDKLINKDELLSLAKLAIEGPKNPRSVNPPPPPRKKEVVAATKKEIKKPVASQKEELVEKDTEEIDKPDEKILYVLDSNAENLPPEILYEEAYFRMELNDGSSLAAARKYLDTQKDWNTQKNLKFIFDFLYDTDSEEFEYFISNKSKFHEVIPAEKINRSMKILVENKLYQGIPRPDFERSKYLLSLIDSEQSTKNNYHYFLNRLYAEGKESDFKTMCHKYFKLYEAPNQEITIKYLNVQLSQKNNKSKLKGYLNLLNDIDQPEENFSYLLLYSKIYLKLSDKDNALLKINRAIDLGEQANLDVEEAKVIRANVEEL